MHSILFVPADRPSLVGKAATGDATMVCLDLEDGVAQTAKATARSHIPTAAYDLKSAGKPVALRINSNFEQISHDLAIAMSDIDYIVVPKTASRQLLDEVETAIFRLHGQKIPLIAFIENARGLKAIEAAGSLPESVSAFCLGTEDFAADLGVSSGSKLVSSAFFFLALMAARYGVSTLGYPGSIAEFRDLDAFAVGVTAGKEVGSIGGFAIHPAQVGILNSIFALSADEVAAAREVVSAFEAAVQRGEGAINLNGKMIDQPVYLAAKRKLQQSPDT